MPFNKKFLLFSIFIIGLFSLLPASGYAQVVDCASDIPGEIQFVEWFVCIPVQLSNFFHKLIWGGPLFLLVNILGLIALALETIYKLAITALIPIIHSSLNISLTPGYEGTPEFITKMWEFMRDFANMFFLLILVFSGFATILRIKEYEAKVFVVKLLIVAAIINFSGVFVAFIVDMGNLLNKFFLDQAANIDNVLLHLSNTIQINSLEEGVKLFEVSQVGPGVYNAAVPVLLKYIILSIYYFVSILIFIIIMFMFLFRKIALYLLVVISPLAIFASVIPQGKGIFQKWWSELLSWSFAGVPILFGMYMATFFLGIIQGQFAKEFEAATSSIENDPAFQNAAELGLETTPQLLGDVIGRSIELFIPLIIIVAAIWLGTQAGPDRARSLSQWGWNAASRHAPGALKKAGIKTGAWTGRKAGEAARKRIPEPLARRLEKAAAWRPSSARERGLKGLGGKALGGVYGYTIGKAAEKTATVLSSEKAKKKEWENFTSGIKAGSEREFYNTFNANRGSWKQAAVLGKAFETGNEGEIIKNADIKDLIFTLEELLKRGEKNTAIKLLAAKPELLEIKEPKIKTYDEGGKIRKDEKGNPIEVPVVNYILGKYKDVLGMGIKTEEARIAKLAGIGKPTKVEGAKLRRILEKTEVIPEENINEVKKQLVKLMRPVDVVNYLKLLREKGKLEDELENYIANIDPHAIRILLESDEISNDVKKDIVGKIAEVLKGQRHKNKPLVKYLESKGLLEE